MPVTQSRKTNPAKPGFFYGYIIVASAFLILIAYSGARSAFGVFFNPMAAQFGWSAAALSTAFSISIIMDGSFGIVLGQLTDKIGPRMVLTLSGIFIGVGYLLLSTVSSIWQMYLLYGVVVGIGMGGGFVPIITSISRWFISRRSMMNGIVLSGVGIGMLVTPPIANWLIARYHWSQSYIILGTAVFLIMVISAQFLRRDPSQVGQSPYNNARDSIQQAAAVENRDYSLKEAITTGRFWMLFFIFACVGFTGLSLMVHLVPHVINLGISSSVGATVLATVGGANIGGRLFLGAVADRMGTRTVYIIGFIILSMMLLWLVFITETWALFLFAVVFGFGQGGLSSVQAPMVAELFGLRSHGLIFGAAGFGAMVGGTVGPILLGYLFDINGNYHLAFITCLGVMVVGLILSLMLARINTKTLS